MRSRLVWLGQEGKLHCQNQAGVVVIVVKILKTGTVLACAVNVPKFGQIDFTAYKYVQKAWKE